MLFYLINVNLMRNYSDFHGLGAFEIDVLKRQTFIF